VSGEVTSVFLRVGGELCFRFEGLPHALASRIRIHLPPFVASDPGRSPHRGTGDEDGARVQEAEVITVTVGEPVPDIPGDAEPVLEQGELRIQRSGELVLFSLPGATAWCVAAHGRGGILLADTAPGALDALTGLVIGPLLIELAVARGWLGLKAAAIAWRDRGVLLPGPNGDAKSTICEAAASAELDVLSDELMWVRPAGDDLTLWAFPRAEPGELLPLPTTDGVPLAAVVHPAIVLGKVSRLVPLIQMESFEGLAGQDGPPSWGLAAVERFRMLAQVAQSPAWRLEIGSDRTEVPQLLRAVMRGGR